MRYRFLPSLMFLLCATINAGAQRRPVTGLEDTSPLADQGNDCVIAGRVLYADGFREALGVEVELLDDGIPRDRTMTDQRGVFRFLRLPRVSLDVQAKKEGFKTGHINVNLLFLCRSEGNVILLEREDAEGKKDQKAKVSARELSIPKDARKAFEKGLQETRKNQEERSLPHFRKAIEIYPDYDAAYIELAMALLALNQDAEAEAVLKQATTVYTENARAFLLQGILYGKQGRADESTQAFQEAVRLDGNNWLSQFELARCFMARGQMLEALPHAQRAHVLSPATPKVHGLLYEVAVQTKDYEGALAEIDDYLERFPDDSLVPALRQRRKILLQMLGRR